MSQFKKYDSGMSWDQLIKRGKDKTAVKKVSNPTGFQADSLRINANRIKNGEDVGHYWLEGRLKKQLLEYTDVTESGGSLYFATGGVNKMKLDAIVKAASKAEKASQFVLDCATQEKEMEAA